MAATAWVIYPVGHGMPCPVLRVALPRRGGFDAHRGRSMLRPYDWPAIFSPRDEENFTNGGTKDAKRLNSHEYNLRALRARRG